eukprot:Gregarina_sp_Poly_1__423@NODE_1101_length_5098_cov_110_751342_g763_i0_p1_GENE_NODE_1101_length_5098_cov_110_751342_g763_i0NODE_1101_length_5098_cov_110_751342_g763_i0_p1_ORF_typecomplete_len514_score46_46Hexokinase_1/PF00349_21/2e33Hexokinase_2/PF03727_16/1e30_NODE_1101_length_5098_cov_110_751342_g763_i019353476
MNHTVCNAIFSETAFFCKGVSSCMGSRGSTSSNASGEDVETPILFNLPRESFKDRVQRYLSLFTLSARQLADTHREICRELELGCRLHSTSLSSNRGAACSLKMLDTFVPCLPCGSEVGIGYGVGFASTMLSAARVVLKGNGSMVWNSSTVNLLRASSKFSQGLLDQNCTSSELFDCVALCLKRAMHLDEVSKDNLPIGFVMGFPLELHGARSGRLLHWIKGFETGRATDDPVEGFDVVTLLERSMQKFEVPGTVSAVANDTTALLMAGAYEGAPDRPPCAAACILGMGFNAAYLEPNAEHYRYRGVVIDTQVAQFDKAHVATDIDRELDFSDESAVGGWQLEKLAGGGYLGEICRRLLLRVWRADAPAAAWNCQALPTSAAILCVIDSSKTLYIIERVIWALWEWHTDYENRAVIKSLFSLVFERSAALTAATIASVAKRTGRLSPGTPGITVALDDSFHVQQEWFQNQIKRHLRTLLGPEQSRMVHLRVVTDSLKKGAAVLGHLLTSGALT